MRGGNFPTSSRRGSIESLAMSPSGTFISSSSVMRAPIVVERLDAERHRHAPHGAEQIDRDGKCRARAVHRAPDARTAAPCRRPAASSRGRRSRTARGSSETGCEMRTSSPACSSCAMKSARVSMLTWSEKDVGSALGAACGWPRRRRSAFATARRRSPRRACAPPGLLRSGKLATERGRYA